MNFLKNKWVIALLITIVAVTISIVVYNNYQKKIYGGVGKAKLTEQLANDYALEMIESIKVLDGNIQSKLAAGELTNEYELGVYTWYDNNRTEPIDVNKDGWFISKLKELNIDYVKHPKVLDLAKTINSKVSLANTFSNSIK